MCTSDCISVTDHRKQQPWLTPLGLQSATGARSATFRALIFSKGAKPEKVNQVRTFGFGSHLLTRKPMGKNWHGIQDKCNRWETLRKDRGEQWERLHLNYRLTDCSGKLECELHISLCPQIWHFSNRLFFPRLQQLISFLSARLQQRMRQKERRWKLPSGRRFATSCLAFW